MAREGCSTAPATPLSIEAAVTYRSRGSRDEGAFSRQGHRAAASRRRTKAEDMHDAGDEDAVLGPQVEADRGDH